MSEARERWRGVSVDHKGRGGELVGAGPVFRWGGG